MSEQVNDVPGHKYDFNIAGCSCGWLADTNLTMLGYYPQWCAHAGITYYPKDDNRFHIGETSLEALFDRVLVLVDVFKSGYECSSCGGSQVQRCGNCDGKGFNESLADSFATHQVSKKKCSWCDGKGDIPCASCQGKGVKEGGIVVPETSQNPPQAGTIVSVGEDVGMGVHRLFGAVRVEARPKTCAPLKIGDRVMFGRFAGHDLSLSTTDGNSVALRLLNESEVLCRMQGILEMRKMAKSTKEELL